MFDVFRLEDSEFGGSGNPGLCSLNNLMEVGGLPVLFKRFNAGNGLDAD